VERRPLVRQQPAAAERRRRTPPGRRLRLQPRHQERVAVARVVAVAVA